VREEVYQMMRWWLDKGVDGFRMDVINYISKAPGLPDANTSQGERYQFGGRHFVHGPRLTEYLDEMKREVLSKYDVLTVGEMPWSPAPRRPRSPTWTPASSAWCSSSSTWTSTTTRPARPV
jgi:glycosidase